MSASVAYRFTSIAKGQTTSIFIHGYGDRDAVSYSATIYNQATPGVLFPQAHVIVTQGETFRWSVDHTIGRKVYIANQDPFGSVGVDVLEMKESF